MINWTLKHEFEIKHPEVGVSQNLKPTNEESPRSCVCEPIGWILRSTYTSIQSSSNYRLWNTAAFPSDQYRSMRTRVFIFHVSFRVAFDDQYFFQMKHTRPCSSSGSAGLGLQLGYQWASSRGKGSSKYGDMNTTVNITWFNISQIMVTWELPWQCWIYFGWAAMWKHGCLTCKRRPPFQPWSPAFLNILTFSTYSLVFIGLNYHFFRSSGCITLCMRTIQNFMSRKEKKRKTSK